MKFSEAFASIQGEGKYTGCPSIFFRTSYCNIRCSWCDSGYTSWDPENKDMTAEEALNTIIDLNRQNGGNYKHLVITGGEPFLWAKEIDRFLEWFTYDGFTSTIETNATIFYPLEVSLVSMSPKLSNSTPWKRDPKWADKHERQRINIPVINQFIDYCTHNEEYENDYQLKFVVQEERDLDEIEDLLKQLEHVDRSKVYLMSEGITKSQIEINELWLVEECQDRGFRYSDRLHVRLYGDKRGV